jgi:hypothetical protein
VCQMVQSPGEVSASRAIDVAINLTAFFILTGKHQRWGVAGLPVRDDGLNANGTLAEGDLGGG